MKDRTAAQTAVAFCRHYLGRYCFAPFTGQDYSAWHAFVYTVEMYGRGDLAGRACAVEAMRSLLAGAQRSNAIHQVFIQSIVAVLDWTDAPTIWRQLHSPYELHAATTEHSNAPKLRAGGRR